MEGKGVFILCCIATVALALPVQDTTLVTESKPGQEYVFVQSSGSGAKPIARKDKTEENDRPFETAHKLPPNLTYLINEEEEAEETVPVKPVKKTGKKVHKRSANPAERPAPAPPGAVKISVAALLKKYEEEMKSSAKVSPSSTTTAASTTKTSRRRGSKGSKKRTEREAKEDDVAFVATSPRPVLTTSKIAPQSIDTDVVGSPSEKQRSRIQIKKGPNGQEYEYEYVYYYYDDDEDSKDKVKNSHDGPAKNAIARSDKTREKQTPEANEIVPSRGKTRGRQLGEEEHVQEERLPANTRFPPRSRNLNTTPLPEDEAKPTPTRGRGRGKPTSESTASPVTEDDNVSEETQGSRGRTRANVRRPSLELVDNESFNTHSSPQSAGGAQSPSFPAQLPAGPEEPVEKADTRREPAPVSEPVDEETSKPAETAESTTLVTGMDKVALDLYAISQGTQKLFGEEGTDLSTEDEKADAATTSESSSTEEVETTTPTTTSTTTTTTTTPAPTTTTTKTTTTTTEAPTKASRFGGRRNGLASRKTSSTTTETPVTESKLKKFGRPSFGGRSRTKTTAAPAPASAPAIEEDVQKEESKPVSQSKPARSRFGVSRPRGRTTAAPEEQKEESKESSTSAPSTTANKPSLPRARPSFNGLRGRGRSTTAAPSTEEGSSDTDSQPSSSETSSTTTTRPPRRIVGTTTNIKALRPGPRINLAGRRGASSTSTTEVSTPEEDHHVTGDEEETPVEAASEKEEDPAPTPVETSPLARLRSKSRLNIQPKAKAASAASASAPVQVRRVNPLLNRRKPGQTTEAPSSEAPSSEATEAEAEEPAAETEPAPSSTTTEEPKGLSKLLAGRRRLATRTPGTINHK